MSVTASKIRVAIIGTGFGQKVHIPAFQAHPDTEIIAVYHRDIAKAQANGRIAPTLRVIDRWVRSIRSRQTLSPGGTSL
ncbi:MAG: Gfo/Idh/MocA family oxidoreductase [Aphanocapsa sp. GSE-SYN-MK-11-07L]|jgi:predicted dehydrogenase|nr:Gfo/Idh/MocA family oxidoreductase [Aphanocapsa sp. GSE-SYN-MK-11-07L]